MRAGSRIVLEEGDFADSLGTPESKQASGSRAPHVGATLPAVSRGTPKRIESPDGHLAPLASATAPTGNWFTSPATAPLLAAAIGVVLSWAITELIGLPEVGFHSKTGSDAVAALWTGAVGLVFGGTILAFDSAVAGAWDVAAKRFISASVPMFAASFASGWIANVVYLKIAQDALENELRGEGLSKNNPELYLARGLGWALFGIGIGVTVGLLTRSRKRAINGALGGALGGAAGGLAFELVAANLQAGASSSRLLGLVAIGALIALATRAIEAARREAWLQVLAGGMVGKEFILYHALTRLGSSPECEIFLLKDPAVAKHHAQIDASGLQRVLSALPGASVLVNGFPATSHVLRNGDRVQIGSTVIGYSERAPAGAVTG
jgi:Inner membrane component of T3SS, cytoplasmic domain